MTYEIDNEKIFSAIYNTFKHRNKLELLEDLQERYNIIKDSDALKGYWLNYQRKNYYARDIEYSKFGVSIDL